MKTNKIFYGDCLQMFKMLPDDSVDVIVTDPPYLLNVTRRNHGNLTKYQTDLESMSNGITTGVLDEMNRVCKTGKMFIFCSKDQLPILGNYFIGKGFYCMPIPWHKRNVPPLCGNTYLSDTEHILCVSKKIEDIIEAIFYLTSANLKDKELWGHPTIKPQSIIEDLITRISKPGDLVLDPYMGSGTTAVACIATGRNFIGAEIDKNFYDICMNRINTALAEQEIELDSVDINMRLNTIHNQPYVEGIKHIPDASIDMAILDLDHLPTAAIESETNDTGVPIDKLEELIRVMKKINIYIWCSNKELFGIMNYFIGIGCSYNLLYWHKTGVDSESSTKYLLYFRRGGVPLGGTYNTKRTYHITDLRTEHMESWNDPDIKPLKMTENIIINSSKENDIILDCTAGSGTVEVACINQNRNYIAFEESKDLYDTANRRIAEKLESDKPKYDCEVVCFSEIDKHAIQSYTAIHNVSPEKNLGDITKVSLDNIPELSCLVGGSPYQDFSVSGNPEGALWTCNSCGHKYNPLIVDYTERNFCPECHTQDIEKTHSSFLVHWLEILRNKNPKFMVYENVKALTTIFKDTFDSFKQEIESYGYNVYDKVLNCKDYGIPQNCERVFLIAIRKDLDNRKFVFPEALPRTRTVSDFLEDCSELFANTDQNILIDESIMPSVKRNVERDAEKIIASDQNIFRMECTASFQHNRVGVKCVPALCAVCSGSLVLQTLSTPNGDKHYIKKMSPKEAFRFMGFDDTDYEKAAAVVCKSSLYKQAGNSTPVNVLYAILKNLFKEMPYLFEDLKLGHFFSGIGSFEKAFEKLITEVNAETDTQEFMAA